MVYKPDLLYNASFFFRIHKETFVIEDLKCQWHLWTLEGDKHQPMAL